MILITGATGQLGNELQHLLDELGKDYIAVNSSILDITDTEKVEVFFSQLKPDIVFHCAAYTAVDAAEVDGRELNDAVNILGTKNIARASAEYDTTLVYISTDYVFDGEKIIDEVWLETDSPNPKTEYGRAKYLGEKIVEMYLSKFYIIRTSWIFSNYGRNFVSIMQELAKHQQYISVVNDQYGRPTWARTLAEFIVYLVENRKEFGCYHLSNDSDHSITWYDFAVEILKDTDVEITPISSRHYLSKTPRPFNSTMDLTKAKLTGFNIPNWKDALNLSYQQKKQ